jgi:hypothetical protein
LIFVTVACARAAMNSCAAGGIAWSAVPITAQLGMELLDEINVPDPARVADQLVMLRDGAMVSGYLSDPSVVADALDKAGRAIIAFNSA